MFLIHTVNIATLSSVAVDYVFICLHVFFHPHSDAQQH